MRRMFYLLLVVALLLALNVICAASRQGSSTPLQTPTTITGSSMTSKLLSAKRALLLEVSLGDLNIATGDDARQQSTHAPATNANTTTAASGTNNSGSGSDSNVGDGGIQVDAAGTAVGLDPGGSGLAVNTGDTAVNIGFEGRKRPMGTDLLHHDALPGYAGSPGRPLQQENGPPPAAVRHVRPAVSSAVRL
ncbi:hypothetical protein COO60DRAFT_486991 [Scenedesmus sp. NREL 46B-D3]|nr:hypothetical protein COO60DRAFT_486991 [Scenedesmus sp. NREL 46B-D3]